MSVTRQSKERPSQRRAEALHPAAATAWRSTRAPLGADNISTDFSTATHAVAPTNNAYAVEWRPLNSLHPLAEQWRALAARAIEPNVFYEPAFALAAAPLFGSGVNIGLVWSTESQQLVGLFPLRTEQRRYGAKLPILIGWTHPFAPLGVPLFDRACAVPAISAVLNDIAADPALPKLLLLPFVAAQGRFAAAFQEALAERGARTTEFDRHDRALLSPGDERGDYLARAIGAKKRKDLRRQRRRLAESGPVDLLTTTKSADVLPALHDFLDLEVKGWKGSAGSAAAQDDAIRIFVEDAVATLLSEGKATIVRLTHNNHAIAAGIILRSGDGAWFWKIAYDEALAGASPGAQLTLDVTDMLLQDRTVAFADSCATADHSMINHIWRERLPVADWLIALQPSGGAGFTLVRALETLRREAIAAAKRARDLIRGG